MFSAHEYYSRWLIPLLTHTLPLPAVLMVWDALFSRPMRQRDENPKLDYLMDVCTSMLLCARATLLQYVADVIAVVSVLPAAHAMLVQVGSCASQVAEPLV